MQLYITISYIMHCICVLFVFVCVELCVCVCVCVLCYVMLYGYLYSASHSIGYSEALSASQAGEKKSSNYMYAETHVTSPVASHSGVQEECHSRVQGPLQQRSGSWTEKYRTKVQEDHSDQQSAADEPSGANR